MESVQTNRLRRFDEPLWRRLLCRPILCVCLFVIVLGLFLSFFGFGLRLFLLGAVLVFAALSHALLRRFSLREPMLFTELLLIALALLLVSEGVFWFRSVRRERDFFAVVSALGETECSVTAEIVEMGAVNANGGIYYLDVKEVDSEAVKIRVLARLYSREELMVGDVVYANGFFRSAKEPFGEYRSGRELSAEGVSFEFCTEDFSVEESPGLLRSLRTRLIRRFAATPCEGFLRASFLADRSLLAPSFRADLQNTGASHLLALSGLHLGLMIGLLEGFLRLCAVDRRIRLIAQGLLCLFFLLLSGAPLSLLRASAMFALAAGASLLRVRSGSVQNLLIALSVLVIVDRCCLYDAGLQLSAAATLGVLFIAPRAGRTLQKSRLFLRLEDHRFSALLRRLIEYCVLTLVCSFAALTFTLPVLAVSFGRVSLYALLFSVVQIPLFSFTLAAALLWLLTPPAIGWLSVALLRVLCKGFAVFSDVTATLSDVAGEGIYLGSPYAPYAALVCCVLLFLLYEYRIRMVFAVLTPFCFVGIFLLTSLIHRPLTAPLQGVFVDASGGEALYLKSKETSVLVVSGEGSYQNFNDLREVLEFYGVHRVQALVVLGWEEDNTQSRVERFCEIFSFDTLYLNETANKELQTQFTADVSVYTDGEALFFKDFSLSVFSAEVCRVVEVFSQEGSLCLFCTEDTAQGETFVLNKQYDAVLQTGPATLSRTAYSATDALLQLFFQNGVRVETLA